MISQTAEYALRVVVLLAARQRQPLVTHRIAIETCVPEGYLSKVLQQLGRAGIVESQRGMHGGFVLAADPNVLTVYDVIQIVDPIRRIQSCPLGNKAHVQLCPLHRRLDDAAQLVEQAFRRSTIADLLRQPEGSRPLCEPPPAPVDQQPARLVDPLPAAPLPATLVPLVIKGSKASAAPTAPATAPRAKPAARNGKARSRSGR